MNAKQRQAVAHALRVWMEAISEDEWCAGWLMDLEHILWSDAINGRRPYLAALAELAGGWWRWDTEQGTVFVPLDEWKGMAKEMAS